MSVQEAKKSRASASKKAAVAEKDKDESPQTSKTVNATVAETTVAADENFGPQPVSKLEVRTYLQLHYLLVIYFYIFLLVDLPIFACKMNCVWIVLAMWSDEQ